MQMKPEICMAEDRDKENTGKEGTPKNGGRKEKEIGTDKITTPERSMGATPRNFSDRENAIHTPVRTSEEHPDTGEANM